uniref:Ribonuclease HII n=1 Tax=Candidatus Kentrum sp. FM TaxID=2126340 RepID=A0A450TYY7_9GAMM|nr:MAG: ribonuclease HII [Candidatus Kentron sp. FM]VFJ75128.1 MAG: ribonuclease HII [Candidatus Kentron sp. FM]VFK12853.1 MAG: ribonuclease HII [Candidatus Kentron sp. FM]
MADINRDLLVAGVDEAGRGPLAGPVLAAAVILDPDRPIPGIGDSKALSPRKREELAELIRERSLAWAVGRAEVEEIDTINILQATLKAMERAVLSLSVRPVRVLVDGNRAPALPFETRAIVRGDKTVPVIGAASILAKVTRDAEMVALDRRYPRYGFAKHKGYPTRQHRDALEKYGPCPVHRVTFAPVRSVLNAGI